MLLKKTKLGAKKKKNIIKMKQKVLILKGGQ